MGPIYRFLGLTVGVIKSNQPTEEKRQAYAADITYGTNNEFGFDYLRDNLAFRPEDRVQRTLELRDRRRGRLDPDRRGAHAADHLGPLRGEHRALRPHQSADPVAEDPQAAAGQGQRRHRVLAGRAARRQGQLARHDVDGRGAREGQGRRPSPDRGRAEAKPPQGAALRPRPLHDRREVEAGAPDRGRPRVRRAAAVEGRASWRKARASTTPRTSGSCTT